MPEPFLQVVPPALRDPDFLRLKNRLINTLAPALQKVPAKELSRENVRLWLEKTLESFNPGQLMSTPVRQQLLDAALADIIGYGPLELLLSDPLISEVMVNGPRLIFVERNGELFETDLQFEDELHLTHIIDRILLGRNSSGMEMLKWMDPRAIADLIRNEVGIPTVAVGSMIPPRKGRESTITAGPETTNEPSTSLPPMRTRSGVAAACVW